MSIVNVFIYEFKKRSDKLFSYFLILLQTLIELRNHFGKLEKRFWYISSTKRKLLGFVWYSSRNTLHSATNYSRIMFLFCDILSVQCFRLFDTHRNQTFRLTKYFHCISILSQLKRCSLQIKFKKTVNCKYRKALVNVSRLKQTC